ncbi:ATP-binding protein [Paenibacillus chartarius]|uniref:histidine kinase n=1 Tax=Paenibacillus chartarius TaxID=747481 RepID=A0ABV6DFF5_9BACL
MLSEYFLQIGLILFPITVYQIWTFGKSFNQLPFRSCLMGLYGGGSAILCELTPVHIFGVVENFQCVPIILSILYGKMRAGMLSIGLLSAYHLLVMPPDTALISIAAMFAYSALPLLVCGRFEESSRSRRFAIASVLSLLTMVIQILFLTVYFSILFGADGPGRLLVEYGHFLGVACVIQLLLMAAAFLLLEHIIDNGRVRRRLESLVKYNPVGISAFDMDNRFVSVNPAYEKITGYKESELLGKSRLTLWFEDDHHLAEKLLQYALDGEIKKDKEAVLRHKQGHQIHVRFTVVPIVEGERMFGYFALVTDITESKLAEEMLRNSEKLTAIGQLAAGVAHEIRNPLTSIKGFLQLMSASANPAHSKYYEIIGSELTRIESIVSEMLILAKPQAIMFQHVSVRTRLEEVVSLLAGEANMQGVEIITELGECPDSVMGDGNQLKQVFLNVVKNAIEAMPDGGKLSIRLLDEQDRVTIAFADEGVGIPEEMLRKIGEPFYSTKMKGTGLGFLVSKRIIANHQGTMHISSAVNEGTTVTLSLPRAV